MATQVFECPVHKEFDVLISFSQDIPQEAPCPVLAHGRACCEISRHIIKAPAGIIVRGGTGAGRGNAQARKDLRWDEACNRDQHDPYTQATAQMTNSYHEQKDMGMDVAKPTEAGIQEAAKRIDKPTVTGKSPEARESRRMLGG